MNNHQKVWHASDPEHALDSLNSGREGISSDAAQRRLAEHGYNRLPEMTTRGPLLRFLYQFHNVLIYVLLVAAVVTAILGHWIDSGVILAVVLINTIIGFIQEGKAEDALRAIRKMLSAKSLVLRDGKRLTIAADELVPGDVVLLQSGDKVPADMRLFRIKGLQIQEAALTGESVAVHKTVDSVAAEAALGDRYCMAYSGTLVTYGQGSGVVVATGSATEIGRISSMVAGVEQLSTPLLQKMDQFGRWLTSAILAIAAVTFAFGVFVRDYTVADMFLAAVGLAVAAIPEGLPAIMTITLAIGVQRMAGRNAIIRRLPAVETLGAVTVICSDKTGTLTRNEMTVRSIITTHFRYDVSGTGYDPHGSFSVGGREVDYADRPVLTQMLRASLLCNETTLQRTDEGWQVHGDPMEGALMIVGLKSGVDPETEARLYPRDDIIPFESDHKFMATLHHNHQGEYFIFVKGAPEQILQRCNRQLTLTGEEPIDRECWERRINEQASKGQRLLAVAMRPAHGGRTDLEFEDVKKDLMMLGLYGLIDPPREEAITAVARCREAGIRVKMITGDHGSTAMAIAAQLNLENTKQVLTGTELEALDDKQLSKLVRNVDVYARVSPEHKLRLVSLLQGHGMIVAMTGDGVNDAPALKRADVGVAMGEKGTEASKEAAEMVLADDNFASITAAVREGRTVYANIKKVISWTLPTNAGEASTIIFALLLGMALPITPVQILWVNMITAVTLGIALAFEPADHQTMVRPPRPRNEALLSGELVWHIILVAALFLGGVFGIYLYAVDQGYSTDLARTIAMNTLVVMEIFHLLYIRNMHSPRLSWPQLRGTRVLWIAIALVIVGQFTISYLPPLQQVFGTESIHPVDVFLILCVGAVLFVVIELEKRLRFHFRPNIAAQQTLVHGAKPGDDSSMQSDHGVNRGD